MTVREFMDQLALEDPDREITVQDTNGWRYDFYLSDEGHLSIAPLSDTRYPDE